MAILARTALLAPLLLLPGCGLLGIFVPGPLLSAFDPPDPLPTIPGPEEAHLLDDVHGTLLWRDGGRRMSDDDWNEIEVFDLPSRTPRHVELPARVGELTGPDDRGRFVYADYAHYPSETLRLHELPSDRDVELLAWKGPRTGQSTFALSPRGGDLLVSCWTEEQKGAPRMHEAFISNLDTGARRNLGALDLRRASWLPDGRHLAVEAWVPDATPPADGPRSADEATETTAAGFVRPSVQVLDADTGHMRWLAWGRGPCACPDGRKLLYYSPDSAELRLRDLESGAERVIDLPGLLTPARVRQAVGCPRSIGRCYTWLNERIVLYDALPTEGDDPGYVPEEGLQGYYPRWSIKVADVDTRAFVTLVRSANAPIGSFGAWKPSN